MFEKSQAFSGFSVDDLAKAKKFYGETLGVEIEEMEGMGMLLHLGGGGTVFIYPKENHQPATFTVLNFPVDDIDAAVKQLKNKDVKFEKYEGMHQDDQDIARGREAKMGPDIAWFTDPSGNVLSVLQN